MKDAIQVILTRAIYQASELNTTLESLSHEKELSEKFYAPVFSLLIEGSRFLKTNLNIIYTRYSQRKEAAYYK